MFILLFFCEYFILVQYTELIKKYFKNSLFLRSYFESLSMAGTNKIKQKKVSWIIAVINVVIVVSCFILYTFSFFSRTCFMLIVYEPSLWTFCSFKRWLCKNNGGCVWPTKLHQRQICFLCSFGLNLVALNK